MIALASSPSNSWNKASTFPDVLFVMPLSSLSLGEEPFSEDEGRVVDCWRRLALPEEDAGLRRIMVFLALFNSNGNSNLVAQK